MKTNLNSQKWEKTMEEIILDSYLDYGAPATFYIRDCVPQGLIKHIDPTLWDKYARPLLYVNNTGNAKIDLKDLDFLLFTPQGIVTRTAKSERVRKWEKIAAMYAANQAKVDETNWPGVADAIADKLADSLAKEIVDEDTKKVMPRLLRRIVRVMVDVDELPPAQLPYLPVPPEAANDAAQSPSAPAEPTPPPTASPKEETAANDKYQVDF